jgi:DNA-binding MarR family transcriptional regulator
VDPQEIKTLKLFEAIEENNSQSQRELSRKLEISLGLVNSLLKRIVKKGFYKIISVDKNKLKYILTPKGVAEKTVLTYRFITHSLKYYEDMRDKLQMIFSKLEQRNVQRVVFLGVSGFAEIAFVAIKGSKLNLVGVADENQCNRKFFGMQVVNMSFFENDIYDAVVITAIERSDSLKKLLIRQGIEKNKIVAIT